MKKLPSVRARSRQGTRSLDITIPTSIIEEYGICEGDVFVIETESTDFKEGKVILKYKRVFAQR